MSVPPAYAPPHPQPARIGSSGGDDVVAAGVLVLVMTVVGALAGLVWQAWSPARPAAQVLGAGAFIPDETEAFIAADGRFLVISATLGLVAAVLAWFVRPANRGVAVAAGLVVGGLAGAALTELVGHLTGGGSATGRVVTDTAGAKYRLTDHLPLSVHLGGLRFVEAAVAALVYGVLVAFTAHDDLGRPDPAHDRQVALRAAVASVDAGGQPQDGWGYGDAAGATQQRDLPPQ